MVTIDDDTPLYVSIDHHHGLCLEARYELKNGSARAQPDWAYEFPYRTGQDTQICWTGPAKPD